jgi:pilus assembly protein Flp/PilA
MNLRVIRNRSGATAIEYGLLAALISIAAVIAIELTGVNLTTVFGGIGNSLQTIAPGSAGGSSSGSSGSSEVTAQPQIFSTFVTVNDTELVGNACEVSGNGTTTAFQATDGTDVTSGGNCADPVNQPELQNAIINFGEPVFFNPTDGGAVTVPDFDGPGTGFTVPSGEVVEVLPQFGFFQVFPSPTSSSVISTLTASCTAMDGAFSDGFCQGVAPSTSASFGTMLLTGEP